VYAQAVKRRERMTDAERTEYDRAVEWAQWAQMGTKTEVEPVVPESEEVASYEKDPA
jgi:hypothetical protein